MISLECIQKVKARLDESKDCVRTPLVRFNNPRVTKGAAEVHLKMESMQTAGSFKIRGIIHQISELNEEDRKRELVTFSAGNYGRAFSYLCSQQGLKARVVLPAFSPKNRVDVIKSNGAETEQVPNEKILGVLHSHVERGCKLMHPYNDVRLIEGYTSCGVEILEDLPDPDIVVVCCGGGGLLSGIATAIKMKGPKNCRIYGVEPANSCCMHKSMEAGKVVGIPNCSSIASGLSPPDVGTACLEVCMQYVEGIILVSEDELKAAVKALYRSGIVAEASGGAAFATLLFDKIPDIEGKKVVLTISGRNISPHEVTEIFGDDKGSTSMSVM